MQQVLNVSDTLHLAGLAFEILDQVGLLELPAQVDDTVFDVDVDLALRHVGVAEDLGLDLARQCDVVGLRLLLLLQVSGLLLHTAGLSGGVLRPLPALPSELAGLVGQDLASTPAAVRVEEIRDRGSDGSCENVKRHRTSLVGFRRRLPGSSQAKPSTERSEGTSQIRGKSKDFPRPSRPSRSRASASRGCRAPPPARRPPPRAT